MNTKTKIGSLFFLAAVLVAGTISLTIPKSLAEPEYYGYEEKYTKDPYEDKYTFEDKKYPFGQDHDKEKNKGVSIQKIKCINSNVNINDVDVNKYANGLQGDEVTAEALQGDQTGIRDGTGNGISGNGGIDIERNLVNVCLDINLNAQNDELFGFLFR